jgi:dihydroorotate dehydrogenase (NAD+) catalytic subunit
MSTSVGGVSLRNPVLTASGTSGHGAELGAYFDLSLLGGIVVKSLAATAWPGNPAPRVHQTSAGMLNAVGLQGPGVEAWVADELPGLRQAGARVVASIWGQRVEDYEKAAAMLAEAPAGAVAAVEVNVSCPNLEDPRHMFAHSATATAEAVDAAGAAHLPRWAKLSPNVTDLTDIADAALAAGAEALTLVNTVLGMAIDVEARRPVLAHGGGGLSGPGIHPVAVRAVWDVRAAFPDAAIVGVGGVIRGADAVELLLAGASAVEVGTATFADPTAPLRVLDEMRVWCAEHGTARVADLIGAAHRG